MAKARQSFVVTTGTASGKSLSIRARVAGEAPRTRATVIYPMNALANSQLEEIRKFVDQSRLPEQLRQRGVTLDLLGCRFGTAEEVTECGDLSKISSRSQEYLGGGVWLTSTPSLALQYAAVRRRAFNGALAPNTAPTTMERARILRCIKILRSTDPRRQLGISHRFRGSAAFIASTSVLHNRYR